MMTTLAVKSWSMMSAAALTGRPPLATRALARSLRLPLLPAAPAIPTASLPLRASRAPPSRATSVMVPLPNPLRGAPPPLPLSMPPSARLLAPPPAALPIRVRRHAASPIRATLPPPRVVPRLAPPAAAASPESEICEKRVENEKKRGEGD